MNLIGVGASMKLKSDSFHLYFLTVKTHFKEKTHA